MRKEDGIVLMRVNHVQVQRPMPAKGKRNVKSKKYGKKNY